MPIFSPGNTSIWGHRLLEIKSLQVFEKEVQNRLSLVIALCCSAAAPHQGNILLEQQMTKPSPDWRWSWFGHLGVQPFSASTCAPTASWGRGYEGKRLLQQHRRTEINERRTHSLAKKQLQKGALHYFSKATSSSTGKQQERKAQAHSSAENPTINSSFLPYFGKHLYTSVHTDSRAQERSFSSCWGFTVSAYILKYCKKIVFSSLYKRTRETGSNTCNCLPSELVPAASSREVFQHD